MDIKQMKGLGRITKAAAIILFIMMLASTKGSSIPSIWLIILCASSLILALYVERLIRKKSAAENAPEPEGSEEK